MKGNFININYKENKKNKNIYFICPYLSLNFQTITTGNSRYTINGSK